MNKRFPNHLTNYTDDEIEEAKLVFNCLKNADSFGHGDNLDTMILESEYDSIPCDTKYRNGYGEAINILENSIGSERIFLRHQVAKIHYGDNPVRIVVETGTNSTKIISAKHVLVTVSIGVLKLNLNSMFDPLLPDKKRTAINNMGFGKVVKIFMEYENPFWGINDQRKFYVGVNDSQYSQRNTVWTNGISNLYVDDQNPNVLMTVYVGDFAKEIEEMDPEDLTTELTNFLRNLFGDLTISRPKSVITSKWVSNPLIRGAYSYSSFASISSDYLTIADSIPDNINPKIFFAGEATDSRRYSTVHGARFTGIREAEKILNHYSKRS